MSDRLPAAAYAAALLLLAATSACGGGAEERLASVSEKVGRIRSGVLDMRLTMAAVSAPESPVGFAIEGPFEVGGEDLEADLRYRQIAGSADAEVRFIAADGRAFVETGGAVYELPVEQDPPTGQAPTVLQELGFESWAADPTVVGEGPSGQVTIASPLDTVRTLDGLGRLLDELEMKEASGIAVLDELDDEALERAVRAGSLTVRVGPDDLLRTLVVRLRFGVDPTSPLADVLEGVAGAELVFTVDIAEPNQPVHVEVPRDARPISEMPGS